MPSGCLLLPVGNGRGVFFATFEQKAFDADVEEAPHLTSSQLLSNHLDVNVVLRKKVHFCRRRAQTNGHKEINERSAKCQIILIVFNHFFRSNYFFTVGRFCPRSWKTKHMEDHIGRKWTNGKKSDKSKLARRRGKGQPTKGTIFLNNVTFGFLLELSYQMEK